MTGESQLVNLLNQTTLGLGAAGLSSNSQLVNSLNQTNLDLENVSTYNANSQLDNSFGQTSLDLGSVVPYNEVQLDNSLSQTFLDLENPITYTGESLLSNTLDLTFLDQPNPIVYGGVSLLNDSLEFTFLDQPNPPVYLGGSLLFTSLELTGLDFPNPSSYITNVILGGSILSGSLEFTDLEQSNLSSYIDSLALTNLGEDLLYYSLESTDLDQPNPIVYTAGSLLYDTLNFTDLDPETILSYTTNLTLDGPIYTINLTLGGDTLISSLNQTSLDLPNPTVYNNTSLLPFTFNITNLDLENGEFLGGPNNDLTTSYPETVTGTPNLTANPGPPSRFIQRYTPTNTYLNQIDNLSVNNSFLSDDSSIPSVLAVTNLDNSNENIDGGIPYKTYKDPTVYPLTTTERTPIRGWFSEPGQAAEKFGVVSNLGDFKSGSFSYNSENTYLEYINNYI